MTRAVLRTWSLTNGVLVRLKFEEKLLAYDVLFLAICSGADWDFYDCLGLTPLVRLFSFKIDAVDYPNARRINTKPCQARWIVYSDRFFDCDSRHLFLC